MESSLARRLWHVVRAVLYMLRKGMAKRKLAMDLHLLLQRGKIAGKIIGKLMTQHHHHHAAASADASANDAPTYSRRVLNPNLAVYDPRRSAREVEFSCSNTRSYPALHLNPSKHRRRNRLGQDNNYGIAPGWYNYDAADIAKVFEVLNNEQQLVYDAADAPSSAVAATPSPALWSTLGRSPASVRQLRITDSPFPVNDEAAPEDCVQVDRLAEEFIRRFYEQLQLQQSVSSATPECGYSTYEYARPVTGMA